MNVYLQRNEITILHNVTWYKMTQRTEITTEGGTRHSLVQRRNVTSGLLFPAAHMISNQGVASLAKDPPAYLHHSQIPGVGGSNLITRGKMHHTPIYTHQRTQQTSRYVLQYN